MLRCRSTLDAVQHYKSLNAFILPCTYPVINKFNHVNSIRFIERSPRQKGNSAQATHTLNQYENLTDLPVIHLTIPLIMSLCHNLPAVLQKNADEYGLLPEHTCMSMEETTDQRASLKKQLFCLILS